VPSRFSWSVFHDLGPVVGTAELFPFGRLSSGVETYFLLFGCFPHLRRTPFFIAIDILRVFFCFQNSFFYLMTTSGRIEPLAAPPITPRPDLLMQCLTRPGPILHWGSRLLDFREDESSPFSSFTSFLVALFLDVPPGRIPSRTLSRHQTWVCFFSPVIRHRFRHFLCQLPRLSPTFF